MMKIGSTPEQVQFLSSILPVSGLNGQSLGTAVLLIWGHANTVAKMTSRLQWQYHHSIDHLYVTWHLHLIAGVFC